LRGPSSIFLSLPRFSATCQTTSAVRYRGLSKNTNRLHLLAAFTNLLIGEKYLLA